MSNIIDMSRRSMFGSIAGGGAAALFASASTAQAQPPIAAEPHAPSRDGVTDEDVLNFALNLEDLEAEYYLRGVMGQTLDQATRASLGAPVRGGRRVSFSDPRHAAFLQDVAANELAHVEFLRGALGSAAIRRPPIDFGRGFAAALGFDPFHDDASFFLGAMLFEDVGVTAYKGAAPLLRNKSYLQAAAGIHAVEAYHAGMIRTVLFKMGARAQAAADRISATRNRLDGPAMTDQGITAGNRANIVPADSNGIAYSRTPQQVLNIVYGAPGAGIRQGGFFPDGLNGRIQQT